MIGPDEIHEGGCLCGAVRFETRGKPLWIAHCHCRSCRHHTGSAFATFVGYKQAQFRVTQGALQTYASSPGVVRSFCGACGTPLTFAAERWPGEVHVYVSTLDRPEAFEPKAQSRPWTGPRPSSPRPTSTSASSCPGCTWTTACRAS
jgi:hypothetical protein